MDFNNANLKLKTVIKTDGKKTNACLLAPCIIQTENWEELNAYARWQHGTCKRLFDSK